MYTLQTGLGDLSRELNENSTNTGTKRIGNYNDAVIEFFNEKRWPFAVKTNTALTTTQGLQTYDISAITDMRWPGPIKEIFFGDDTAANSGFKPVDYENRHDGDVANGSFFYVDESTGELTFLKEVAEGGKTISIRYWFTPARVETLEGIILVPERYRTAVALLAASKAQGSRYLSGEAARLYNLYIRQLNSIQYQQSERSRNGNRRFPHPLRRAGFRRTYPR